MTNLTKFQEINRYAFNFTFFLTSANNNKGKSDEENGRIRSRMSVNNNPSLDKLTPLFVLGRGYKEKLTIPPDSYTNSDIKNMYFMNV